MYSGKKGFGPIAIIAVVAAAIILIVVFSSGAFASKTITSGTARADGCKPKNIAVSVKGSLFTADVAAFGVIAEPERITVDEVKAGGKSLRAFSNQDFTWKVQLYDDFTNNLIADDGGSNTHPGGSAAVEDKYALNFFVPDNNCDDQVDDFEGRVVGTVKTDDGEEKSISRKLSFSRGKLVR